MSATTTAKPAITKPAATAPNGLKLLQAVDYNRHLFAALAATRSDWRELIDSIPAPGSMRKNVAAVVWSIREALGLEADYALDICQGKA